MAPWDVAGEEAGAGDLFVFQMKYLAGGLSRCWPDSGLLTALVAPLESQPHLAEATFAAGGSQGSGWGPTAPRGLGAAGGALVGQARV